ncbi:MAG: BatA domain-containing protein, partial [Thermoguttaceae bacterium]
MPLVGVVVLIHLINMLRHQYVEWAAMEFLLASYRKSRTRLLLQQILLLLLRMFVIVAAILLFAQPRLIGSWGIWFGEKPRHHLVLLDDSFSMNERNAALGGTSLIDDARRIILQIAEKGTHQSGKDRFSLLLLSSCRNRQSDKEPISADIISDLPLDETGLQTIRQILESLPPSQSASEPALLFREAATLLQRSTEQEKPICYFLSDFRQKDWENPASFFGPIETIRKKGGDVRLIRLSNESATNLTLDRLDLVDGIHAAEVDLLFDAKVTNHSNHDVENMPITPILNGRAQPNLLLSKIKGGETTTIRFPIRVADTNPLRVELRIPADSLSDDNNRFAVVKVPDSLNVLILAPAEQGAAHTSEPNRVAYIRAALSPGGAKSGIRPRVESPSFLLNHAATNDGAAFSNEKPLSEFHAIFLFDVPALEPAAVRLLEEYVADGGGLAFFLGPNTDIPFVRSSLYKKGTDKEGAGLFPCAPIQVETLLPDFLSNEPDLQVSSHPIFRLFNEDAASFLHSIRIEKYIGIEQNTSDFSDFIFDKTVTESKSAQKANSVTENKLAPKTNYETKNKADILETETATKLPNVLARLRGGLPLVIEKSFGKGKTITFLTTADPLWNNWGRRNPSFVVVMLELAAWLSRSPQNADSLACEKLTFELDTTRFQPNIDWTCPLPDGTQQTISLTSDSQLGTNSQKSDEATIFVTPLFAGFYELSRTNHTGEKSTELIAINVDAREGKTRRIAPIDLTELLKPANLSFENGVLSQSSFEQVTNKPLND